MGKNNSKGAKPAPKKEAKATKPVAAPPKTEEPIVPEVVEPTTPASKNTADITIGELVKGNARQGLSPDSQVELNRQVMDLFVRNPKAAERWGIDMVDAMTDIAAISVTTSLIDEAVNGNSRFAVAIKKVGYKKLAVAAGYLGIELPPENKLLAGPTEETAVIQAAKIKVPEEVAAAAKKEHETEEAGNNGEIELDPKKVAHMGEDALKKALEYFLVASSKRRGLKDTFADAVDFMREYRMEIARQAENSTEAMNKYDDRSMKEWLADIFQYVKPTMWIKGIGKGLYSTTMLSGNPIKAFLILRSALMKGADKPVWDDQSIADTVSVLVEMIANDNITAEKVALEALDKNAKGYRDVATKHEAEIKKNEAIIASLHDISFDIIDKYKAADEEALKIGGKIIEHYYPDVDLAERPRYTNLENNICQYMGIILNLFRAAGNKNELYMESNISELDMMSIEDYNKLLEEKKKSKTSESKKDLPLSRRNAKYLRMLMRILMSVIT